MINKTTPKCPICGRPATPDNKPFCSRRCADVDLNRWLNGVYAVPAVETDEEEDLEPTEATSETDD